ncbi:hypothetical protein CTI12_AA305650 [Artemisia annua]|uniref:ENTH domain-containing protein n=1 Tax=Artemisia annua TaxID=35608 RepID=A0A2U1N4K0_ARTAN|nr:hypothetical protein CTI12_AA305650 [Artemisia annua]
MKNRPFLVTTTVVSRILTIHHLQPISSPLIHKSGSYKRIWGTVVGYKFMLSSCTLKVCINIGFVYVNHGVIFAAISATRPRADVAYCIQALARRLSKTSNWAVALKTLIVIHRALREVDPTFQEELLSYGTKTLFNLSNFKDDSSPKAWDYSSWIRTYALYLEERLNCFHILKYDVETERIRTRDLDTPELFGQLSALQQLLYRVLG